jgi:hypothetical protein
MDTVKKDYLEYHFYIYIFSNIFAYFTQQNYQQHILLDSLCIIDLYYILILFLFLFFSFIPLKRSFAFFTCNIFHDIYNFTLDIMDKLVYLFLFLYPLPIRTSAGFLVKVYISECKNRKIYTSGVFLYFFLNNVVLPLICCLVIAE